MIKYLLAVVSLFLCAPYVKAQQVKNVQTSAFNCRCFILTLPSTDCINCKASAIDILHFYKESKFSDSLFILTDNDAGAFHAEQVVSSSDLQIKVVINEQLAQLFSMNGKATLAFSDSLSVRVVEIKGNPEIAFQKLIERESNDQIEINAFRVDSVNLKYNIFSAYGNSIVSTGADNIMLFSKTNNIGCLLRSSESDSLSSLFPVYVSEGYYDTLFRRFNAFEYSDVPQEEIRAFSRRTTIPLARIYQLAQTENSSFAFFSFFTANSDTLRSDSIVMNLIYNIGVGKTPTKNADIPTDLSEYSTVMPITSLDYEGNRFQLTTIPLALVAKDDRIFLPFSPAEEGESVKDSLFYLAEIQFLPNQKASASKMYRYVHANFSEECVAKEGPGSIPVVLNRVRHIFDFGPGKSPINYQKYVINTNVNDTLTYIFDFRVTSDTILKVIALTKSGKTVIAHVHTKGAELQETLAINEAPIAAAFLQGNRVITVNSSDKTLISHHFVLPD